MCTLGNVVVFGSESALERSDGFENETRGRYEENTPELGQSNHGIQYLSDINLQSMTHIPLSRWISYHSLR